MPRHALAKRGPDATTMIEEIFYILALPSWEPNEVSPFQGFAPGLFHVAPYLVGVPTLPSDISELAMCPADRLARRRAGLGAWQWSPVTADSDEAAHLFRDDRAHPSGMMPPMSGSSLVVGYRGWLLVAVKPGMAGLSGVGTRL